MAYIKQKKSARGHWQFKYYHTGKCRPKGTGRRPKLKPTTQEQRERNKKNAQENLEWKMLANFVGGEDLYLTLKYDGERNRSITREEMAAHIREFNRQMRKAYRKEGKEYKFIYVYGIGSKGSRHFHMVVNKLDVGTIQKCWNKATPNAGRVSFDVLYESEEYAGLAEYFIEHSERTFDVLMKWTGQRYHCSRNLEEPVIEEEEVTRSSTFRTKPRVPNGFALVKNSVYVGADFYGYKYFTYRIRKIE